MHRLRHIGSRNIAAGKLPRGGPAETLTEINRRFAAVPFAGSYWISLKTTE